MIDEEIPVQDETETIEHLDGIAVEDVAPPAIDAQLVARILRRLERVERELQRLQRVVDRLAIVRGRSDLVLTFDADGDAAIADRGLNVLEIAQAGQARVL